MIKIPKPNQIIRSVPLLAKSKGAEYTVLMIHDPPFYKEKEWPPQFKAFFSQAGLPSLEKFPMQEKIIGQIIHNETGQIEDLREADLFFMVCV